MEYDSDLQQKCQDKLDELLSHLMEGELSSEKEVDDALTKMREIYLDESGGQNAFRHNYSRATSAMFSPDPDGRDNDTQAYDFYSTKVQTLVSNVGAIRDRALAGGNNELLMPLMKLYDHVNLELVRTNYYARLNDLQDKRLGILSDEIQGIREDAKRSVEETANAATNKAKKLIDDSKAETQRDNVTVLGIFTGIVVAFVAGMTFSSSILQNIDKASSYRLGAMAVIMALFFFDLVALLISFLGKVARVDTENIRAIVIVANVVLIVLLALIVIARLFMLLPPYPQG